MLYSVANKLTTAANTIVLQFTAPIFVILFSALFFHKKATKLDIGACCMVLGGIVFFFLDSLSMGGGLGNFLALLSGVTYAGVFMMNDLPEGDAISSVFFGEIISSAVGLPFLLRETDFSLVPVTSLLILGVFQVGLAYILLSVGLKTTPPITASLVSGLEPILSPVWVALFYGETMGAMSLVGAGIVLVGVIGYNILKIKQSSENTAAEH
jgi:drug/metabolite transporter (DMT)-like permease